MRRKCLTHGRNSSEWTLSHREHLLPHWPLRSNQNLSTGCQKGIFSWSGTEHIAECLVQENGGQRCQADPSHRMEPQPRREWLGPPAPVTWWQQAAAGPERHCVSLGESPWPHVEDSLKAPQRAEGVIKQVGRKESDSHNTWLPGSAEETLDRNIILLILLLPAFPLHSLWRTSDWLKREGKDQKHGVILPLLSFQELSKTSKADQRNMWRARWKTCF